MKNTMNDTYQCKDLMLAAALLTCDVPLLGLESQGRYFTFVFDSPEKCRQIEQQWWAGKLMVSATKYAEAIKRLKNLVYSKRF